MIVNKNEIRVVKSMGQYFHMYEETPQKNALWH